MIKIFLESDKFSHKAGVSKHATNSLARKSHIIGMLCVCVGDVMDVVFSVCIVRRGAVGARVWGV